MEVFLKSTVESHYAELTCVMILVNLVIPWSQLQDIVTDRRFNQFLQIWPYGNLGYC